jgi:hypothetical protein
MLSFEYLSIYVFQEYFPIPEDYANAASFFLAFALALFAFHIIARAYFSPELALHKALNVIGSLVFGFLTWILVAGMLATGFLMLPLDDDAFYKSSDRILFSVHEKFVFNFDKLCRQIGGGSWKYGSPDGFIHELESETRHETAVKVAVDPTPTITGIAWPAGSGYLSQPKHRPAKPHYITRTYTVARITGIEHGEILFSGDSKIEYRGNQRILVSPGATIAYLAKSPDRFELKDYNGDRCTLIPGLTVTVDRYGQFVPADFSPEGETPSEKPTETVTPKPAEEATPEDEEPSTEGTGHIEVREW